MSQLKPSDIKQKNNLSAQRDFKKYIVLAHCIYDNLLYNNKLID
jgi:hypothetical protein